jgi:hypothetical protein
MPVVMPVLVVVPGTLVNVIGHTEYGTYIYTDVKVTS